LIVAFAVNFMRRRYKRRRSLRNQPLIRQNRSFAFCEEIRTISSTHREQKLWVALSDDGRASRCSMVAFCCRLRLSSPLFWELRSLARHSTVRPSIKALDQRLQSPSAENGRFGATMLQKWRRIMTRNSATRSAATVVNKYRGFLPSDGRKHFPVGPRVNYRDSVCEPVEWEPATSGQNIAKTAGDFWQHAFCGKENTVIRGNVLAVTQNAKILTEKADSKKNCKAPSKLPQPFKPCFSIEWRLLVSRFSAPLKLFFGAFGPFSAILCRRSAF